MSGSTIGGVIGGAVGFFVGGPAGAQWGWMIGSTVGGYVDPEVIEGPRLKDLRGTTSAVGGVIPRAWGTAPVPCNIIWQQPGVTEIENSDNGKGGGTVQKTYTYTRSYAVMFHLGEIAGVLQIKRNGKIVYDARDDATLQEEYTDFGMTLAAALQRIAGVRAENAAFINKCTIYTGTQTQNPDPTIESYKGVGNVPSYRGRAYMVVTDDDVTELQGAIPQYEVIVASCGDVTETTGSGAGWLATFQTGAGVTLETSLDGSDWSDDPFTVSGWLPDIEVASAKHGNEIVLFCDGVSLHTPDLGQTFTVTDSPDSFGTGHGMVWLGGYWHAANVGGTMRSADGKTFTIPLDNPGSNCIGKVGDRLVTIRHSGDPGVVRISDDFGDSWATNGLLPNAFNPSAQTRLADNGGNTLACICLESGSFGGTASPDYRAHILYTEDGTDTWEEATSPFADVIDVTATTFVHYAQEFGLWLFAFEKRIAYGTHPDALTLSPHVFSQQIAHIDSDMGRIMVSGDTGMLAASINAIDWNELSIGNTQPVYAIVSMYNPSGETAIPDAPGYYTNPSGQVFGPPSSVLTPCGTTTIGEIVAELCEMSGLTSDEYDVSDLTDVLTGYVVARETDAASVIESLRPIGMFDPAEWDGKVRFVKRGGTAVGSINGDDLVERDGDAYERELVQEAELLRRVTTGYLDPAASYAPNTQKYERRAGTVQARGEATFEVSAVMDADQAATVSKRKVLTAWGEPEKQKFSLPYRLAKYTPTDVLNYTHSDGEVYTIRLMQIEDDSGIRYVEAATNCAEAYNATATGVPPKPPTITDTTLLGPTDAVYMNLPSLRTQDNTPGVTIAACGLLPGWPGASIMLSADDGVSYQEVTQITAPSVMGRLTANCTDSSEPISVQMTSGSLSSITDAQLALRLNAFAIQSDDVSELGQFQTATAGGSGAYDLTNTVRGGLGTTAASHEVDDRFVMVSTAQFVPLDISLSGRTLYFKAVSFGTSADAAVAVPFVFSPLFTTVVVNPLTSGGSAITVDGQTIFVVS